MLLRRLSSIDFSMWELHIYLDTHPNDTEALALLEKYNLKRTALVEEYENKYGPLNTREVTPSNSWRWIANPWPWDYSEEEGL